MRLEDGCLEFLETHFEKFANINYEKSPAGVDKQGIPEFMPYTSGSGTTIKTKNFHPPSRLEVRAKVPETQGHLASHLAELGKNKWGWPANGEIDMQENISQQPDVVNSTFHLSPDGVSKRDASRGREL